MSLIFSDFYRLDQLAKINLRGNFSTTWDGTYRATANGKEPYPGSGLTSGGLPMFSANVLPVPIQALLQCRGLIYIFVSTLYPVLYVGISKSDLQTGIFGPGRFSHHVRKLLAALGGGTNHTGGWTEHAVQRYRNFVHALDHGVATLDETVSHLCGDWRFSFAPCDLPDQHEGFVLDQMENALRSSWGNVTILNTASVQRVPINLQLPPNLANVVAQTAPQGKTPTIEAPLEPPMLEQPELACMGMVYKCQQTGDPRVYVAEHGAFSREYGRVAGGKEHILFLCSGADVAGVQAAVQAVCQVGGRR